MASSSSSSSAAALSLYEKYTQLNHQLDAIRDKRSLLQKQVQDTRERLDEYETQDKPALRQSTQQARDETEQWQEQLDTAQEEVTALQSKRDALARSRDRLEQDSWARKDKQRTTCRNFLAASQTFRERHCPQLHLRLSMMKNTMDDVETMPQNVHRITLLRAVALANGFDDEGLPEDVLAEIPTKRHFDELEIPTNGDDIDWDLWDTALGGEDEADDDDICQKMVEFKEQRKLFEASKRTLHEAKEHLRVDVAEKYETCHRYKEQLEAKLQRLSKEIQQLEIDISTTLAVQSMDEEEEEEEEKEPAAPPRPRVSLSPPNETVVNPYRRRTNQSSSGSARPRTVDTPSAPPPPQFSTASRPRHGSTRKRKSAFGSSMEIGGAEVWSAAAHAPSSSSGAASKHIRDDDFLKELEDSPEDDELLSFSPFHREKR